MTHSRLCLLAWLLLAAPASAEGPMIRDAWVRQPPPGANAAGYLTLHNPGAKAVAVVGARSPVSDQVELHRTVVEDGVARMRPVERLEVPAGGEIVLAPRGLHLMLLEPKALQPGDRVQLTLELEDGETVSTEAEVRKQSPDAGHHGHH